MVPLFTKILLLAFLIPSLSQIVRAEPVGPEGLAKLLATYSSLDELKVKFQQIKHMPDLGVDLRSEGRLHVQSGGKVRWEILKPSAISVQMDAEHVTVREGQQTPQVFDLSQLASNSSARALALLKPWLTMDAKVLAERYTVERTSDRSLHFVPKAKNEAFVALDLRLNAKGYLSQLTLHEPSGDGLEIQFSVPELVRPKAMSKGP